MPKQSNHAAQRVPYDASQDEGRICPKNVGDIERIASAGAGTLLAFNGLTSLGRSPLRGLFELGLGAALVYRGASGWCSLYSALGINHTQGDRNDGTRDKRAALSSNEGIRIEKTVTVAQPPDQVFRFWRDLSRLPQVMTHLDSVKETDAKHSHWVAKGPLGMPFEWDAEILEEKHSELISWKSIGDAPIAAAGSVHFKAADDGQATAIRVLLRYSPPGGSLGDAVAHLLGAAPEQQIEQDLERYAKSIGGAAALKLETYR